MNTKAKDEYLENNKIKFNKSIEEFNLSAKNFLRSLDELDTMDAASILLGMRMAVDSTISRLDEASENARKRAKGDA